MVGTYSLAFMYTSIYVSWGMVRHVSGTVGLAREIYGVRAIRVHLHVVKEAAGLVGS